MNTIDRPEEIPEALVAAWNKRDADGIAELFDEDAEFVNVVGLWWHNREAIRRVRVRVAYYRTPPATAA